MPHRSLDFLRAVAAALPLVLGASATAGPAADGDVLLPAGDYVPAFVRQENRNGRPVAAAKPVHVDAFRLDRMPVTNGQFLDFVARHPEWRRSNVKALFADGHYLASWQGDLALREGQNARQPVTGVSWFAAGAYCRAKGGDLPTTDQWEYALWDQGRGREEVRARTLAWYGTPNAKELPAAASAPENGFGIRGLVGLVWEWTLDLENAGTDLRGRADRQLFCGGASLGARDPSDYAAFMRFAFRSCLKPAYTTNNLGFRCARP